jgi:hypothetical protein
MCDRIVAKEEQMALKRVDVSKNKAGRFECVPKTVPVSKSAGDGVEWVCNDGSITRIVWGSSKGNPFPGPPVGSGGRWAASGPPKKPSGPDPERYHYDLTVSVDGKDETADPDVEVVP